MPSAYLKRRLRTLDEALGERGMTRTDVGLSPTPINENEPQPPVVRGVPFRTVVLACFVCLVVGLAIGAGLMAALQGPGGVGTTVSVP